MGQVGMQELLISGKRKRTLRVLEIEPSPPDLFQAQLLLSSQSLLYSCAAHKVARYVYSQYSATAAHGRRAECYIRHVFDSRPLAKLAHEGN